MNAKEKGGDDLKGTDVIITAIVKLKVKISFTVCRNCHDLTIFPGLYPTLESFPNINCVQYSIA
jgi:hypothetical protein